MPKIIENLKENLIAEARRQLLENGYAALNLRSVAKGCNTAVGTIYNYFPSKDILAANVMLADWQEKLGKAERNIMLASGFSSGLKKIYVEILEFEELYKSVFEETLSIPVKYRFSESHIRLCGQVDGLILLLCDRFGKKYDMFTVRIATELMLTGCVSGWPCEKLIPAVEKII